jgi:hypothetical protein
MNSYAIAQHVMWSWSDSDELVNRAAEIDPA